MLRRIIRRLAHAPDGNVAIEVAMVSPVLVFMALGAFDFGIAYSVQTSYEAAIRAGYEYAFTHSDELTAIAARVRANVDATRLETGYPEVTHVCECSSGTAVSCSATCSGESPYTYVNIKVRGRHDLVFDWPFINGQVMYVEYEGRVRVK